MDTKTIIRVSVADQRMRIVDAPLLASGGKNEAAVAFDFCEKWNGYAKTAVFYRSEDELIEAPLDENDTCIVPSKVYKESGRFSFLVVGQKDGTTKTAIAVRYRVQKGLPSGESGGSGGSSGGNANGLTFTEKNLILTLFRNAAYVSGNMNATLTQLESLWIGGNVEPDDPGTTEKTLTSIFAVYSGGSVTAGTSVNALTGIVVTAHYSDGTSGIVTGYTLSGTIAEGNNTVTVSYGGKTTTFTVAGVAESSGEPKLLHDWDFTKSLTDSVGGVTVTTENTTQDENGLHFNAYNSCAFTGIDAFGKTIEVEFGAVEKQGTGHGRVLTFSHKVDTGGSGQGIVWHSTGYWGTYGFDSGWKDNTDSNPNSIANSTVTMTFAEASQPFDIFLNGEVWFEDAIPTSTCRYLVLGSTGTVFHNMTIKRVKIYEGV